MTKYSVLVSGSAARFLRDLPEKERIKSRIQELAEDPFRPRPKADIKKLEGDFNPPLYRLRVGDFRILYFVDSKEVKITEIICRSKGYDWLE